MAGPTISDDGRWLWNGKEWVPNHSPPTNPPNPVGTIGEKRSDKIFSPDGKQEWDGQKWTPVSGHSTTPGAESIVNYAELCVDALNRGDMAAAKTYYGKAKELDIKTANRIFESEYAFDIGKGYADIVETNLVQIIQTKYSADMTHFGMGVVSWDIDGHFEMKAKLQNLEIAFNNALAFLGDPAENIKDGLISVKAAFLANYDDDGDGIADIAQRELSYIDYNKMENDPLVAKKVVDWLEFTSKELPDEDVIKQQFRIGLILECAGMILASRLYPTSWDVARTDNTGVTLKFLNEIIAYGLAVSEQGKGYHLTASALAIASGLPVYDWKGEEFQVIHSTLFKASKIYADSVAKNTPKYPAPTHTQECFIATAAYGTPFDLKIDILRNWRDDSLQKYSWGRVFIRNYYYFSPPIARMISKSSILRKIVRIALAPIILILKPNYSNQRFSSE